MAQSPGKGLAAVEEEVGRVAPRDGPGILDDWIGPLIEPAYRLALTIVRDPGAAEDAVQEAALRAWRRRGQLRSQAAVRPWFLAIVANECRRHQRSRWMSVLKMPDLPRLRMEAPPPDALELRRVLAALPDRDRLPLALFFFLDLPMDEVAVVLGVTPEAARARVYRAVRRLRPYLLEDESV